MKAVIVNCSDVVEYRVDMVCDMLRSMNWEVEVLASDFMHIEKRKREITKPGYQAIRTIPYKKNISLQRLYSHYCFAAAAKKRLAKMTFDLLYLVVPANSVAAIAKEYKANTKVKIIIDIIDLWPESLPTKITQYFPFTLWANIRNKNLKYADYIITECDLYQEKLKDVLRGKNTSTIYWCHKKNEHTYQETETLEETMTLCYLGSVNNIIDIPEIAELIRMLCDRQTVTVKLIAAGERKQELIQALQTVGAKVIDYGRIYDAKRKKAILDTCHYGINIMKPTVQVGISMKSVDYFEMGLPILNNLQGDLGELIKKYDCGVNVYETGWEKKICQDNMHRRKNAVKVFNEEFSYDVFCEKLENIVSEVMSKKEVHSKGARQ